MLSLLSNCTYLCDDLLQVRMVLLSLSGTKGGFSDTRNTIGFEENLMTCGADVEKTMSVSGVRA